LGLLSLDRNFGILWPTRQTTESILFEIKINSEQYKTEQKLTRDSLGQLALDIEKTKSAQKLLNDERKAGKVSDE
jgi:hypothetical protein